MSSVLGRLPFSTCEKDRCSVVSDPIQWLWAAHGHPAFTPILTSLLPFLLFSLHFPVMLSLLFTSVSSPCSSLDAVGEYGVASCQYCSGSAMHWCSSFCCQNCETFWVGGSVSYVYFIACRVTFTLIAFYRKTEMEKKQFQWDVGRWSVVWICCYCEL